MPHRFAKNTKVPVTQSIAEIGLAVVKYGGIRFRHMNDPANQRDVVLFDIGGLFVSFAVALPLGMTAQQRLAKWRCVKRSIEGKLISVVEGIESPAQAFLAHVVTPDGDTMLERVERLALLPQRKK